MKTIVQTLQSENTVLKQAQFTFQMPKDNQAPATGSSSRAFPSPPAPQPSSAPQQHQQQPQRQSSQPTQSQSSPEMDLDWSSMTTFDPGMLALLDETAQEKTATSVGMEYSGFGSNIGASGSKPYPFTTLASNEGLMSFADNDTPMNPENGNGEYDWNSLQAWLFPDQYSNPDSSNVNGNGSDSRSNSSSFNSPPFTTATSSAGGLDEMFGGGAFGSEGLVDHHALTHLGRQSSISPVVHQRSPPTVGGFNNALSHPAMNSSSSSLSSASAYFSSTPPSTSGSEAQTPADPPLFNENGDPNRCPRNNVEAKLLIEKSAPSMFAPPATTSKSGSSSKGSSPSASGNQDSAPSTIHKIADGVVACEGTALQKTEKSDKNVEVLHAWRHITSNPNFKVGISVL